MGVSCFREAKFILRWPPLTCFKKACVHLVVDEESELALSVTALLFLQVKLGGIRCIYSHRSSSGRPDLVEIRTRITMQLFWMQHRIQEIM